MTATHTATLPTESKIHLAAREHALLACASWLLAWESECGVNSARAQFCLQHALISAHTAEDNLSEANRAMEAQPA